MFACFDYGPYGYMCWIFHMFWFLRTPRFRVYYDGCAKCGPQPFYTYDFDCLLMPNMVGPNWVKFSIALNPLQCGHVANMVYIIALCVVIVYVIILHVHEWNLKILYMQMTDLLFTLKIHSGGTFVWNA